MRVTYSGVDELIGTFKAAIPLYESWKQRALQEAVQGMKAGAQRRVRVDTGNLRDSIEGEVEDTIARIYSDLEYAIWQELGTSVMAPQPYMIPALDAEVAKMTASFLAFVRGTFW